MRGAESGDSEESRVVRSFTSYCPAGGLFCSLFLLIDNAVRFSALRNESIKCGFENVFFWRGGVEIEGED